MALRFITGDPSKYNLLARGAVTSTNASALFPLANLYDGDPGKVFKFNDAGADRWVKADLSLALNRNLNAWSGGLPTSWSVFTSGTGTVTQDAVTYYGASGSSARLTGGAAGVALLSQYINCRAGEKIHVQLQTRSATGAVIYCQVRNVRTGKYLDSSGDWVTSTAALAKTHVSPSVGTWELVTFTFQVESFLTCGADVSGLQFIFGNDQNADAWLDEVDIIPGVDFVSVHGHNLDPFITLGVQWSDDDSTYTTAVTVAPRLPSFYTVLPATLYRRYWKLPYTGTPNTVTALPVYYGEIILGQTHTATKAQQHGWQTRHIFDQVRFETEGGHVQSFKQALFQRRALKLDFKFFGSTQFNQLLDEWAERSFGGHFPMVVVPDDTDARMVIHGRMTEEIEVLRLFNEVWETDVVIAESGLPVVTG